MDKIINIMKKLPVNNLKSSEGMTLSGLLGIIGMALYERLEPTGAEGVLKDLMEKSHTLGLDDAVVMRLAGLIEQSQWSGLIETAIYLLAGVVSVGLYGHQRMKHKTDTYTT